MTKNKASGFTLAEGFTLVELLIVISIIAIIATMAAPSFMDRAIRGQLGEAMALSGLATDGVADFYRKKGRMPKTNAEAGLPEAGKIIGNFVTSVNVSGGSVEVTLGNRVNKHARGKVLTFRPAVVKGEKKVPIAWVCGYATTPNGMTVAGENTSTILPRHLPVNCRY